MFTKIIKWIKSKPSIMVYLTVFVLFVVWLIFSNEIIVAFAKTKPLQVKTMRESDATVYYCIEDYQVYDDLLEHAQFAGWAFCETDSDNDERYINIVLKQIDGDVTYEVTSQLGTRTDISNAFRELSIKGVQQDFSSYFPTIGMMNGTYAVYLYCHENEMDYGLINTGYIFTKQGRSANLERENPVTVPTLAEGIPLVVSADIHVSVGTIEKTEDGILSLSGWAFCETTENNNDKTVQIIFRSGDQEYAVDAQLENRMDVYTAFKDSLAIQGFNHGFYCQCDLSTLPAGDYQVFVFCRENEQSSGLVSLRKTVRVTSEGVDLIESTSQTSNERSNDMKEIETGAYHLQSTDDGYRWYIDKIQMETDDDPETVDYAEIAGWLIRQGETIKEAEIKIILKDTQSGEAYEISTTMVSRADVTKYFQQHYADENNYHLSGFHAKVDRSQLNFDKKQYEILALYSVNGNEPVLIDLGKTIGGQMDSS